MESWPLINMMVFGNQWTRYESQFFLTIFGTKAKLLGESGSEKESNNL
jgi:hypothetical protein